MAQMLLARSHPARKAQFSSSDEARKDQIVTGISNLQLKLLGDDLLIRHVFLGFLRLSLFVLWIIRVHVCIFIYLFIYLFIL